MEPVSERAPWQQRVQPVSREPLVRQAWRELRERRQLVSEE